MTPTKPTLSAHEVRALSVRAAVDPRTLAKYLRGEPTRSTCAARIEGALIELASPARDAERQAALAALRERSRQPPDR